MYSKTAIRELVQIFNNHVNIQSGHLTELGIAFCGASTIEELQEITWECSRRWITDPPEERINKVFLEFAQWLESSESPEYNADYVEDIIDWMDS